MQSEVTNSPAEQLSILLETKAEDLTQEKIQKIIDFYRQDRKNYIIKEAAKKEPKAPKAPKEPKEKTPRKPRGAKGTADGLISLDDLELL